MSLTSKASPDWWRTPFRMMQTNLRLIDAGLDAQAVADYVQAHGADAWLLNTGGIYSSYPSQLESQTPNPHLALRSSGDIVADAIAAAHERGLKLLARMDFSKVLPRVADAHPDWLYVSAGGRHQVFNELVTTCPSAGYFQEEVFTILDEVLDRYDVDGFFINWFMYSELNYAHEYLGPCHCDTCGRQWRSDTGRALPTGPGDSSYPEWKSWSRQKILDLGARIREHISSRKTGAPLILHDTADIRYVEANNAVGREFWPHQTAESVSAAFTRAPDTPVLVNCVTFLDFPYRMAAEHPERFAQYLIQAMCRGASISTYIMGPPGAIEYPNLPVAAEITRFHRAHDALYAELTPTAEILLVAPDEFMGRGPVPDAVAEFRGIYALLQELHLPFEVVESAEIARLATAQLDRYTTMVIPNAAGLDKRTNEVVDDWVQAGGTVLATLAEVTDEALPRALGVDAVDKTAEAAELLSAYAEEANGAVIPLHGRVHQVRVAAEAVALAHLVPPARYGPPEYCYGHEASTEAALVEHTWGRGRAITYTWSIGRAYRDLALADVKAAFLAALRRAVGQAIVDTTLPDCVEIVLGRSQGLQVMHLVNHAGARRTGYGDVVPLSGHSLRVKGGALGGVRALVHDVQLAGLVDGPDLIVDLPTIGRFEVLVWEGDPPGQELDQ